MTAVRALGDLGADEDHRRVLGLLDASAGLIGIYDEAERLRYANAAFCEAYFVTIGEELDWSTLMRRNHAALRGTRITTDDIEAWIVSVRSRRGKLPRRAYESDLHDGRWIWVVETMQNDGWIVYSGLDVSCLRESERHLRHARDSALREAQTDGLTGVSNRKHVMDHLTQLTEAAILAQDSAGYACVLDLDHFKAINDTHGHAVGDQVLIAFARRVRQIVRLRDGFGRIGGEEFLLLLPDVTLPETRQIMDQVAAAVAAQPLVSDKPDLHVTFSAGGSPILPGISPMHVFTAADAALYRAKVAGRNRVILDNGAQQASHRVGM